MFLLLQEQGYQDMVVTDSDTYLAKLMVQLASPTEPLSREFRFCSNEVFPPCLREPPPPSLDLFDLDMGLRLEFSGIHILISRAFSMDLPVYNHATGSLASLRIRCRVSGSHGPDSGCRGCQKASMTCLEDEQFASERVRLAQLTNKLQARIGFADSAV